MAGPAKVMPDHFAERLERGELPNSSGRAAGDVGLSSNDLVQLFESQATSRRLDLESRRLAGSGKTFYSIGSSGHEGNAAVARALRHSDMAFLHYRSGAFLIERARQVPGSTPIWDMALSFAASSEDPISGGRHKVLGSKALNIPPQTSTIASHLPKAVGAAYSVPLAASALEEGSELPADSVILCSFGDASANHSTAQGAINTACWTAYRGLPLPLILLCEDNGLGISVPTPRDWIGQSFSNRPGLEYVRCDGRDIVDAFAGAQEAARIARRRRKPVFLHMRTVRLGGHAGSDLEASYRARAEIEEGQAADPLLRTAARLVEEGGCSIEDVQSIYARVRDRVRPVMEQAAERPKLASPEEVMAPLVAEPSGRARGNQPAPLDDPAAKTPQHMARIISLTLAEQMSASGDIAVFGEDVGKKGGVYGATMNLQKQFGVRRVFDTLLDEQTILGMAIGLAHNGFLPIPEIQFLAYVHNAEDQIRGEAASLSFFSNGQYANPMVIRIAGLGYQKGFGGHFHNDNSINIFRDIPGIVLACPSHAGDAALMLREAIRLAREEQRVVVFVEPIALYQTKDLHEDGDKGMSGTLNELTGSTRLGETGRFGDGKDCAIVTYGNGTYMARRCQKRLANEGIECRIIDLRWLAPLPMDEVLAGIEDCQSILVVDECRETGSLSEEILAKLSESGVEQPVHRLNGHDTFIPLGPSANVVMVSEDDIMAAARELAGANA